jgi:hypothetical protein
MKMFAFTHVALIALALPVCAWADSSQQQTDLLTILAQQVASYGPSTTAPASADYEDTLTIEQGTTLLDSNDNFAVGGQFDVNESTGTITQDGNHNVAGIFQTAGGFSTASISQFGNSNYAAVVQQDLGNTAVISQQNDNNTLVLNQQNGNSNANVTQYGNSDVTLNQTGSDTANLTFTVTSLTPVKYTYTQSPGSSWTINVTN